jgi:hypothetical protein
MMNKVDLKKDLKHLYQPKATHPEIIEIPAMNFLMIDGAGNPNTSHDYQQVVQALYGVSYTLKFICKKEQAWDYVVMPLEGLWWGTSMGQHTFTDADKDQFQWTMMIMQPDLITPEKVAHAIEELRRKKGLTQVDRIRFETFDEGWAVQIMHIGPYDEEGPTVESMHQFAFEQGYHLRGKHHEIYLGDPRRTDPTKLKTILRHPVEKIV